MNPFEGFQGIDPERIEIQTDTVTIGEFLKQNDCYSLADLWQVCLDKENTVNAMGALYATARTDYERRYYEHRFEQARRESEGYEPIRRELLAAYMRYYHSRGFTIRVKPVERP